MKKSMLWCWLMLCALGAQAQQSFNGGWHTYKTGCLTTQYVFNCNVADSFRLTLTDSMQTFAAPDSLVTLTICYSRNEKNIQKTTNYFNTAKQRIKSEKYTGNAMQQEEQWRYDKANRVVYYLNNTKRNGRTYIKTYTYQPDRATGGSIRTEASLFNGRPEFYTRDYYDSKNVIYKEVRLNDNNRDVVHVETYKYGKDGTLAGRSVFFPEFGITKHFVETLPAAVPQKCLRTIPISNEKMPGRSPEAIRKLLVKYAKMLQNGECSKIEARFVNGHGYEMTLRQEEKKYALTFTFRQYFAPKVTRNAGGM